VGLLRYIGGILQAAETSDGPQMGAAKTAPLNKLLMQYSFSNVAQ
jgi:hypothetical protein